MYRGGGTAGGYSKKSNIEAVKHVPKFLEALKMQYVKKEAKLEDKFGGQWKNEFAEGNAKHEDYDIENAQVVDESGDVLPDPMPEIMPDHRNSSNTSDSSKRKHSFAPKNEKIDLKEFHPTFKSKKAPKKEETNHEEETKNEKKESKDSKKENSKNTHKEGNDLKVKNVNVKRGIDDYVKEFTKEEKGHQPKNKKVKTNLLSFDENE